MENFSEGGGGGAGGGGWLWALTFLLLIRNSNGNVRKWRDYQWFWPGHNENWAGWNGLKIFPKFTLRYRDEASFVFRDSSGRIWTDQQKVYFWCFTSSLMAVTEIFTTNKNFVSIKEMEQSQPSPGTNEFRLSLIPMIRTSSALLNFDRLGPISVQL